MDKPISEPMEGGKGTFVETTDEHGNWFLVCGVKKCFARMYPSAPHCPRCGAERFETKQEKEVDKK